MGVYQIKVIYILGRDRCQHFPCSYRHPGQGRVQDEERGSLGHHQCIQRWHGRADQVPCQPGMYTTTVRPAHRHGQQDCAGQASWSLGDIAIGENGAMNLNINLVDSQLIFYLDFFFNPD